MALELIWPLKVCETRRKTKGRLCAHQQDEHILLPFSGFTLTSSESFRGRLGESLKSIMHVLSKSKQMPVQVICY